MRIIRVNLESMYLRPPGAIPGGNGGAKSLKTRRNQTQFNKNRITPNAVKSRASRLSKARFIPVGGAHNPEVAGSNPVSATMSSEDNGFRYLHSFLLQQQGFCLAAFLMPGGECTRSPRLGGRLPDSPGCSERRFPGARYSRRSGNRSRSVACDSCRSPAPHRRRCDQ